MKLIILRLNTTNKPSPISEGVVEIQINNKPDNMTPVGPEGTTSGNNSRRDKKTGLGLTLP
jgi:hypothetical protein